VKQWQVILATLVIFGAGVFTGASVAHIQEKQRPKAAQPRLPLPPFPFNTVQKREYLARLDRQLVLTQQQYEAIEEILLEGNEHISDVWEPIAPKMRDELKKMRDRIRAELNPDQVKKFEQETPKVRKAMKADTSDTSRPRGAQRTNTAAARPAGEGAFIQLVPAPASTKAVGE